METRSAAQANMDVIRAWIDAHNRQDMKALDYMAEDVEIVQVATGVVYRGMADMRKLAAMAYRRRGWKDITHIFATDDEVCVEYTAKADTSTPLTDAERGGGIHGIDISKARATGAPFEVKVCFVCHIKDGKIDRAREYWDVATITRQLGISNPLAKLFGFFMRRH